MAHTDVSEHRYTVLSNEPVAEGVNRLRIESDVARTIRPGQFMNLQVLGDASHLLRIPLSFKRADAEKNEVELLFAVVGEGTQRLAKMAVGESSTLVGPSGRGWWLPEREGRALLVAGGIGLPPVLAAASMLAAAGVGFDAIIGARTASMLVHPDVDDVVGYGIADGAADASGGYDPERMVLVATDDGTAGHAGFTTEIMSKLVEKRSYAQVYTCGPAVMMAGVARLASERGVDCQVSMERMMGCGFGACSCCNVALAKGGNALCCQDGPVFDAQEVAW